MNNKQTTTPIVLAVFVSLYGFVPPYSAYAEGVSVGGGRFHSDAQVTIGHDSNVLQREENETASTYTTVQAGGDLTYKKDRSLYTTLVDLVATNYFDSTNDNYVGATLAGMGVWHSGRKLKTEAGLSYTRGHDSRGSVDRAFSDEPDQWGLVTLEGGITYGTPGARGRVEAHADYNTKIYDEFALPVKTEDKDDMGVRLTYYHRVQPKTELLAEAEHRNIDFREAASAGRDSTVQKLRGGVTWHATKQTSGTLKAGYGRKDVDAEGVGDASYFDWSAEVHWNPSGRDLVSFITRNAVEDSTGYGIYTKNQWYGVEWKHQWRPRLESDLGLGYSNIQYEGVEREDDYLYSNLGLRYMLTRFVDIGGEMSLTQRDSSLPGNDYEKTVFSVFAKGRY